MKAECLPSIEVQNYGINFKVITTQELEISSAIDRRSPCGIVLFPVLHQ